MGADDVPRLAARRDVIFSSNGVEDVVIDQNKALGGINRRQVDAVAHVAVDEVVVDAEVILIETRRVSWFSWFESKPRRTSCE